jgi:hypothetical protein
MTSLHLTERALQEAAESRALLPATEAAHLRECRLCHSRVATYQHLFVAAAHLPPSVFAFDLTASVLAQLPKAKPAFPWVASVVATLVLGVVAAFVALFGGVLLQAFEGLGTPLGAGLVAVASILVAGQCLELLARHRQHMRRLAFL